MKITATNDQALFNYLLQHLIVAFDADEKSTSAAVTYRYEIDRVKDQLYLMLSCVENGTAVQIFLERKASEIHWHLLVHQQKGAADYLVTYRDGADRAAAQQLVSKILLVLFRDGYLPDVQPSSTDPSVYKVLETPAADWLGVKQLKLS